MSTRICIIVCIIFGIGQTEKQMRRSVFPDNHQFLLRSSSSASLDSDGPDLIKHVRFMKDLSSIFCQSNDDCKHISSLHVCLHLPPISKSLCLRKSTENVGVTLQCDQMVVYFFVLLTYILIFK